MKTQHWREYIPLKTQLQASPHWKAFKVFSEHFIDQKDFGFEDTNGKGWKRTPTDEINSPRARRLNPTRFLEHFANRTNLYICSSPENKGKDGSYRFLLCFDIDNKEGDKRNEVIEIATEINSRLGFNLPWEKSTGGNGLHGWIVVSWIGTISEYRDWNLSLQRGLNSLLIDLGYSLSVDIVGQPPSLGYFQRGILVKAPRLSTVEDINSFFNTLREANKECFSLLIVEEEEDPFLPSLPLSVYTDNSIERSGVKELNQWYENITLYKQRRYIQNDSQTAWDNSVNSCLKALRKHGGKATGEQAAEIYELEGKATGERHTERVQRMSRILSKVRKDYDPSKAKGKGGWFGREEVEEMMFVLSPMVKAKGIKKVSIEDLSVMALLWERNIRTNGGVVPFGSIKGFWKSKGRKIYDTKVGRYRNILVKLGVIEIEGKHTAPKWNGKGFSKGEATKYKWLLSSGVIKLREEAA